MTAAYAFKIACNIMQVGYTCGNSDLGHSALVVTSHVPVPLKLAFLPITIIINSICRHVGGNVTVV